jgi:hypothetical protein
MTLTESTVEILSHAQPGKLGGGDVQFRSCERFPVELVMAEIDEKDVQSFNELQRRLIDVTEKQKFVSQECVHTHMLQDY